MPGIGSRMASTSSPSTRTAVALELDLHFPAAHRHEVLHPAASRIGHGLDVGGLGEEVEGPELRQPQRRGQRGRGEAAAARSRASVAGSQLMYATRRGRAARMASTTRASMPVRGGLVITTPALAAAARHPPPDPHAGDARLRPTPCRLRDRPGIQLDALAPWRRPGEELRVVSPIPA